MLSLSIATEQTTPKPNGSQQQQFIISHNSVGCLRMHTSHGFSWKSWKSSLIYMSAWQLTGAVSPGHCFSSTWTSPPGYSGFLTRQYWVPRGSRLLNESKSYRSQASLVAQWLRICLPMQGTRVRALVWEDPTCRGAAGPVSHNC